MTTPLKHPQESFDLYVGIDTDKKKYAVSYEPKNESQLKSFTIPSDPKLLIEYFDKHFQNKKVLYAYEAGPFGYHLYDDLMIHKKPCHLIHPGSLHKRSNENIKTNRLDSVKICRQLKAGFVKGIRVPDEAYRQLRHLTSQRVHYAKLIREVKQKIQGFLLFEHISIDKTDDLKQHWTKKHLELIQRIPLDSVRKFKLDSFLEDLHYSRRKLLEVHRHIKLFLKDHPEVQKNLNLVRTIPGIGFVTGSYLIARMGSPENLKKQEELGSFVGVVPREHSTGDSVHRGPITRTGDPILRWLLVESAWISIRKDTELRQTYERIRSKNAGPKGAKIAIVAIARRLTHRVYRILKDQRPYKKHE